MIRRYLIHILRYDIVHLLSILAQTSYNVSIIPVKIALTKKVIQLKVISIISIFYPINLLQRLVTLIEELVQARQFLEIFRVVECLK